MRAPRTRGVARGFVSLRARMLAGTPRTRGVTRIDRDYDGPRAEGIVGGKVFAKFPLAIS